MTSENQKGTLKKDTLTLSLNHLFWMKAEWLNAGFLWRADWLMSPKPGPDLFEVMVSFIALVVQSPAAV